jgi:flavin reductase (DIM6/NTAB) family NADH-FMN oxidoreductase RutF
MTERIHLKPGNMLYPLPVVLVSCGSEDVHNIITIAWAGTICTNPPMLSISVRPERFSYDLIKQSGEFVVNLPTASMAREVDFCGVRSGRDTDKFRHCNFDKLESLHVKVPAIAQCPVNIECVLDNELKMGSHSMFIARVVSVSGWDQLHNKKTNAFELEKIPMLVYSHGGYFVTGKKLGHFGFSVKKPRKK